ncbi:MAG: hypothetical protein OXN97_08760 [Bryobacterales bacterium]|nr:hypothetical protein [Bryobacterales bacterium]
MRPLWDNWRRDVFMAIFGALLAITSGGAYQCATAEVQQAALREMIRIELEQNARLLSSNSVSLRNAASSLERFLSGDSPAPTLPVGYPELATVGLRTQLENPNLFRADHRIMVLYSAVHRRLVRLAEVQRTLDAASMQYRAALNREDRRRAAAYLLAVIKYQLGASSSLTSKTGLQVLLACIEQFSAGQDECRYVPADVDP